MNSDWGFWPTAVIGPRQGFRKLEDVPIYHDFDWVAFYGKDERRFVGQESAADITFHCRRLHGRCDFLLLTKDDRCSTEIRQIGTVVGVVANADWLRTMKVNRASALKAHLLSADEETLKVLAALPKEQQRLAGLELLKQLAVDGVDLSAEQFQALSRSFLTLAENRVTPELMNDLLDLLSDDRAWIESVIEEYPDVAKRWVENEEEEVDVVGIAYRSRQLTLFERLLKEPETFERIQKEWEANGAERVWQIFFERNPWIFGYGLNYIFLDKAGGSLEQWVSAGTIEDHGKRTDGLMRTVASISSLCYVEIKTHDTKLVGEKPYRPGVFAPSRELVGGIAQLQSVLSASFKGESVRLREPRSGKTLDQVYNYQPRSFLVIGALSQFQDADGAVEEYKYRAFELFRRSVVNPEILTFDELLARAWHIVHVAECDRDRRADEDEPEGELD